jgi:aquaglyceroporin related protein
MDEKIEKSILASPGSPTVSHDEHATHLEVHHHVHHHEGDSSNSDGAPYQEHGPGIDHEIPQDDVVQAEPDLWWSRTRRAFREPLSEFFGVFILILFGDGWVSGYPCPIVCTNDLQRCCPSRP